MSILKHKIDFPRLDPAELDAWSLIPSSILTDVMNRGNAMAAAIKPVRPGSRLAGQARTLAGMVADSSIVHAAVALCQPGDVLVMNVGGYLDRACWGGIATRAAMKRGIRGVVMDGACRDVAEIRDLGFPLYCAGVAPAGPHKGHGGVIDDVVAVGGVSVRPGDIVVGDDDGIAVVPLRSAAAVMAAARSQMAKEEEWLRVIETGGSMAEILGLTVEDIG